MTAETTTNLPARATLLGQTVSPGMAYGPVYVRDEDFAAAPEHSLRGEEIDTELARLDSAARAARATGAPPRSRFDVTRFRVAIPNQRFFRGLRIQ